MEGLREALTALESELATTGVRVCTDPGTFSPPCLLVEAPSVISATQGAYTLTVPVSLVAPQPANRAALDFLLAHLPAALDACQARQADPGIYSPNGTQNFPSYRITATITVRSI
jgi:hypothetical protein